MNPGIFALHMYITHVQSLHSFKYKRRQTVGSSSALISSRENSFQNIRSARYGRYRFTFAPFPEIFCVLSALLPSKFS